MKREEYTFLFQKLKDDGLTNKQINNRLKNLKEETDYTNQLIHANKKDKNTLFKENFNKIKFRF